MARFSGCSKVPRHSARGQEAPDTGATDENMDALYVTPQQWIHVNSDLEFYRSTRSKVTENTSRKGKAGYELSGITI